MSEPMQPSPTPWRVLPMIIDGAKVKIVDAKGAIVALTAPAPLPDDPMLPQYEANAEHIVIAVNKVDDIMTSLVVAGDTGIEIYRAIRAQDKGRIATWFEQVTPMFEPMMARMEKDGLKLDKPFNLQNVWEENQ
jgi:hypothetical protein